MKNKNELYYILALGALEKLMNMGYLSQREYELAEGYLAEKYRPILRSV